MGMWETNNNMKIKKQKENLVVQNKKVKGIPMDFHRN
jgi:hypothetical protein